MRDEEDGDPLGAQLVNLPHAALPEIDVAHRERFVDEEDFRVHMDGHGEGQAHDHAARVRLDRMVDKLADLGKFLDRLVLLIDLSG